MDRFTWTRLPAPARDAFRAEFGQVRDTTTTPAGLTVGIASRVVTERATVFVKAIPLRSPALPDYARERAVGIALPAVVPAPRLRWVHEGDWLTLVFDHVPGRPVDPTRDAEAVMATLTAMRDPLSPSPLPDLRPITEKLGALLAGARNAAAHHPEHIADPSAYERVLEGADLSAFTGDSLIHADPALSNMIHDGARVQLVDWALASRGAAWVDVAFLVPLLIDAGRSPADAETWAAHHPDWPAAPSHALDLLAVMRPLFLLDTIRNGPAWLAESRRAALPAHQAWARHRLGRRTASSEPSGYRLSTLPAPE